MELRCERLFSESSLSKADLQYVRAELTIKGNALEIIERKLSEQSTLNATLMAMEEKSQEELSDMRTSIEVQVHIKHNVHRVQHYYFDI